MEPLQALQDWYRRQCNGEWEHHYGIGIETCDNPGWWVKIDLTGTDLSSRGFHSVTENVDIDGFQQGDRWMHCYVDQQTWHGAGDETKLPLILETFLAWSGTEVQRA